MEMTIADMKARIAILESEVRVATLPPPQRAAGRAVTAALKATERKRKKQFQIDQWRRSRLSKAMNRYCF